MNRWTAGLALIVAATLAACQTAPQKSELETKNEALEKRISELEGRPAVSAPPAPGTHAELGPAAAPASSFAEPKTVQAPTDRAADARPVYAPAPARRTVQAAPARTARAPRPASRTASRREVIHDPADLPARNDDRNGDEDSFGAEPVGSMGDPAPRRERLSLPEGAELQLVLETGVSSETSNEGDRVVARLERATANDGRILLPGGTVLQGRVTSADPAGRVKGRSRVAIDFDRIVVRGRTYELATTSIEALGDANHRRDAAIIGGSTAAGAIIGGITKQGAKKGAVIGAIGGTGAVLATRGEQVEMPSGSRWTVRVTRAARLE